MYVQIIIWAHASTLDSGLLGAWQYGMVVFEVSMGSIMTVVHGR